MDNGTRKTAEPVAIIGSGCRLPGKCGSPNKLWQLLQNPVDLGADIPTTRFAAAGFFHENAEHSGTTNATKAYFLDEDPWAFDNEFFSISVKEAESMDPQQRMMLEVVYESIESAGYTLTQLKGASVGVFVGQMTDDYRDIVLRDLDCHPRYAATGTSRSILANRISYVFDWHGPSVNVDTACSSSLVALHQAVQALRSGECDMALVAGVNLLAGHEMFSFLSSLHMLSPNGRSRMWDIDADGYARGEGFAAVVIKTLERAKADGDDIEAVIRNTGVNQDGGRSAGLTVPSGIAQAELIRSTYARCGLDCLKKEDRCQYFEAHGTGTQAGDPREAEGISCAFFPGSCQVQDDGKEKLSVGSIKTVIGHLEGTAGLASLLKTSLAVRHGLIPPNMHFNQLNPAIEPFYDRLKVAQLLESWPELPDGVPRRASVNSFGFGGTNAHAIVESYDAELPALPAYSSPSWGPFVLSANSESALEATILSLSTAIKAQDDIDLSRLSWTLQTRRTVFSNRASFSASTREDLIASLDSAIENKTQSPIGIKPTKTPSSKILGVFTGQGAQWASMGAGLYLHSTNFRKTIQELDLVLEKAPLGPTWSLAEELLQQDPARASTAGISQPLCTALQVALVDLLRETGVVFNAVVGHSSGEIGAAYAAGIISARDAILIAYYRGYHSHQAKDSKGNLGKMMAVGMTPEEAEDFCQQPRFLGRIGVAAINSPSSITLSGDAKAIVEAQVLLGERKTFARVLKVDTAYHSHHMQSVQSGYLASLRGADIRPRRNSFQGTCNWYSSVYNAKRCKEAEDHIPFADQYWVDNMVNPVLFSHAVASAIQSEEFDLALEVGPHPALQGPATETIRGTLNRSLPYHGVLKRNEEATTSFSKALGFLWTTLDSPAPLVDFAGFRRACHGPDWVSPPVQKGLPSYPWDHNKSMLKEAKTSKVWRNRNTPKHPLLGWPRSTNPGKEVRWRNILRLKDVEWLQGHQFQGQVLFPAAGYLVMALDSMRHLIGDSQPVRLIELHDVAIHNGVTLDEDSPGVDLNFTIKLTEETSRRKAAEFNCNSSNSDAASPEFNKEAFSGKIIVELGEPEQGILPNRVVPQLPMTEVSVDRFYEWMRKVGLQYSHPFVLESIRRRLNLATVTTKKIPTDHHTIHPATLDSILQGLFAAFCYPGDGRMWTTYLPKSFRSIRFNMGTTQPVDIDPDSRLVADCYLKGSSARMMEGDIDVFSASHGNAEIQFEGIIFSSLEVPTPSNDIKMFYRTKWAADIFSAIESSEEAAVNMASTEAMYLHQVCENTASFYLNQLCLEYDGQKSTPGESHAKYVVEWARNRINRKDVPGSLDLNVQKASSAIDVQLVHHLGSSLPALLAGSESVPNLLGEDALYEQLYTKGLGFHEVNGHLSSLLGTLAYQYPRMRVLEVGAGSGETTSLALRHIGQKFETYTFTDPSPSKVSAGQSRFVGSNLPMKFQILNIEDSPIQQGFQPHSYDLVIACQPLQATKRLREMIQHCRQLLRPGGFFLLVKLTSFDTLRIPFLLAGTPEWWPGPGEDSLTLTEAEWDVILRENGFSGLDVALRDFEDESMHAFSVMLCQATDDRVETLRDPLSHANNVAPVENLLLVGGRSLGVSKLVGKVKLLLSPFAKTITVVDTLEEVLTSGLTYGSAVIYMSGLEEATFARMDKKRLLALQSLFREAKYFLCVTRGSRLEDPYANLIVGIGRSVAREMAHLRLKFVDVKQFHLQKQLPEATTFSEMLLQMIYLDQPNFEDIMWSNENEVALEDGVTLIPRVFQEEKQNDALNSERRIITDLLPLNSTPVELLNTENEIVLERMNTVIQGTGTINQTTVEVRSSSLFRFTFSDNAQPFYLLLGYSQETGKHLVALSKTNGSVLAVPSDAQFTCAVAGDADKVLGAVLIAAIWHNLFSGLSGTIWIHGNEECMLDSMEKVAAQYRDVEVFLTTATRESLLLLAGKATFVHPHTTERQLQALIPRDLRRFVDLETEQNSLAKLLPAIKGHRVDIREGMTWPLKISQTIPLSYSSSKFMDILRSLCSSTYGLEEFGSTNVTKVDQIYNQPDTAIATSVISWTGVEEVQVSATQASRHPLFAEKKTYFLVGLTGDVGFSLCDWMIDHGAKYIAIASRRPAVPPEVLSHFEKKGATVRVFALDISSMESLQDVHEQIVTTMPPIAGVANAALVVRDHPFDSMAFEDLEAVFGPKVVGTKNLDKLFYETPLDFFILFSSIAGIVGKPAQSNYNATCLFMSTLAAQRRKRGFAASAMHFGMLLGFGFIHGQAGPTTEARFRQDDFMAIPEPHYHEIFAQAILSGRPDSSSVSDVIAGLGSDIDTPWRAMPRFWHCRFKGEESRELDQNQDKKLPVKDQLKAASDGEAALSIVRSALVGRVGAALGTHGEAVDCGVGLVSLGLDSLVAVEVRSWILKILDVDVPALKFLNGSSLSDICQDVLSKLPPDLSPWQNEDRSDSYKEEARVNGTAPKTIQQDSRHPVALTNGNVLETKTPEGVNGNATINGHDTLQLPPEPSSYERIGEMSYAQSQLYFLHEYLQNNAHNIAYNGLFRGRINMERLQYALNVVAKRHESLRSAYYLDISTSKPVQAVAANPHIILEHRITDDRGDVEAEIAAVKKFRFEIEKAIVLKVTVLSHSSSLHSIIFNHHHIALDGVGWNVFISELAEAYAGRLRAGTSPTTDILQSIDMTQGRMKSTKNESVQPALEFWRGVYKTIPEPLPTFRFAKVATRPAASDYSINTANMKLPMHVSKTIEREASRIGVTPFHFYLASLATFLARCLAIEDLAVGIVDANRTRAEEMQTIGYFLNMIPIRIKLRQSEAFDLVARRSRDAVLAASTHQSALFDTILSDLDVSRSTPHHPIFQVALNYRKAPLNETSFGADGKIEWEGGVPGGNPYDLFLNVVSTADWTLLQFITQKSLYRASDGEMLLKWYSRAIEALASNSTCEVGHCPIASALDVAEVTELGMGKDVQVPFKGSLVDRIQDVSNKFLESTAVKDDQGHTMTYSQMITRTNQIIKQLQTVSPPLVSGSYVAMLLDPVADAVCSILAIMRLGLVWIPLDTLNHERRLGAVLTESQPQALLYHDTTKDLMQRVSKGIDGIASVNIGEVDTGLLDGEKFLSGTECLDDQLKKPALIIYTSGSTGTPKGVVLTHEGLVNQIYGTSMTLGLGQETTLQHSPLGFDLMIDQIFLALCNGGTVAMVGRSGRGDPEYIADFMVQNSVSLTHFVPSEYLALLNYGHHILKNSPSWRFALSGGEKLSMEARKAFRKLDLHSLSLVNVYGPAEISVACAKGIVPYRETVDISSDYLRPSPNYDITITDSNMNVLPVGFPGEICISGTGVGLGYLKRSDETKRKFITRGSGIPTRTYRSGDLGRILPDGTLNVLGRLDGDSQVKIHGFRVELGEIANALVHVSNGAIVNAAASWRPDSGVLVAFVVFDAGFDGNKSEFIEWLRLNFPLPPVMKPSFIEALDRIPATPNGKIDQHAVDALPLPDSTGSRGNESVDVSLTSWENKMKEIWEETLLTASFNNKPKQGLIHPSSDFFQVGGNSILMIKLKSLINGQFGVRLSMPELFHASTLTSMAALVEDASKMGNGVSKTNGASFLESKHGQQGINWDIEMAGLVDGLPQPASAPSLQEQRNGGLVIVLSGATGFIGSHLLSSLVQDPRIAQVHCIAIRPDAAGNPRHVSVASDKITEYVGELADLSLGLSDVEFKWLADHADAIIHNGAEVSLLKTYQTLRRANVLSTRTLCEMAIPRRIPVHFVSTASVAKVMQLGQGEALLEVPPSPAVPKLLDSVDGYAASKWASEMLLENLAGNNGLSGYVHRLAHVVGEKASELDAVGMLTKYSILMGTLPRIRPSDVTGVWDFITVEEVVRDMIESVVESASSAAMVVQGANQTRHAVFINHCSSTKVPHENLREYLEGTSGQKLKEMEMKEWLRDAQAKGMHQLVYEFYTAFDTGRGKIMLPVIAKE